MHPVSLFLQHRLEFQTEYFKFLQQLSVYSKLQQSALIWILWEWC